jgi:glycosyltransferase involved in cell wall biosynthesis
MFEYVLDARTATPHFPGIGRYVRNLAAHLIPHLRETESLTLLAHRDHPLKGLRFDRANPQIQTIYTPVSPFSLQQQWTIPRLLRRQVSPSSASSVYHSPYYLMPYRVPCPTVLTVYDVIALLYPQAVSALARAFFGVTTALALGTSAHIVTISESTRRDLLAAFKTDPARVTTIHLAAEDGFFPRPLDERQRLRAAYRLPDHFLLYFGINKPHKNLVRLVDAYASLLAEPTDTADPAPALVIAGAWDGRYPEAKMRAAYHGLGESVRFLGPVDEADLPALYSASTAFVFPSRYEGFGLPILEAMACGAPVACGHASSLPEVAGAAAFYFDAEDTGSIAQAIRALSTDSGLRRTLSEAGLRRSREFSWSRTAAETINVYRSLVQQRTEPGKFT